MGAVGPCGPCSEIHVYLEDKEIDFELNQDVLNSGQFIELWNLVLFNIIVLKVEVRGVTRKAC